MFENTESLTDTPEQALAQFQDPSLTELQKDNIWEQRYRNRYIIWAGNVTQITEDSFGAMSVQIKHLPKTLTCDIIVSFGSSQKSKLLSHKLGSLIAYRAKLLTRPGVIAPAIATNGTVYN